MDLGRADEVKEKVDAWLGERLWGKDFQAEVVTGSVQAAVHISTASDNNKNTRGIIPNALMSISVATTAALKTSQATTTTWVAIWNAAPSAGGN